ncbi:MAG: Rieske (2Fe-2S) protein [Nitrospirales bacterium]
MTNRTTALPNDPHFIPIKKLEDLPAGSCLSIDMQDRGIALFNLNGEVHALDNTCPHAGGPLGEGTVEGDVVICPWHGWKFHIPTGTCRKNPSPSWNVERYEVRIVDGVIQVALPAKTD